MDIFDRAERCFEHRVAQLLHEKRLKAEETGAPLNPRKAKRDARTAAGREKLDGLVRRLADLALIQERVIANHCKNQHLVSQSLDGVAAIWLSALAASIAQRDDEQEQLRREKEDARNAMQMEHMHSERSNAEQRQQQLQQSEDVMFDATKSVVQFVLGADDDCCDNDHPGTTHLDIDLDLAHSPTSVTDAHIASSTASHNSTPFAPPPSHTASVGTSADKMLLPEHMSYARPHAHAHVRNECIQDAITPSHLREHAQSPQRPHDHRNTNPSYAMRSDDSFYTPSRATARLSGPVEL